MCPPGHLKKPFIFHTSILTSMWKADITASKSHVLVDKSKVLDHVVLQHFQTENSFIVYKSGDQSQKDDGKNNTHCPKRERRDI